MRPIGTARYRRYSLFAHVTIILRRFRGDANRELPPGRITPSRFFDFFYSAYRACVFIASKLFVPPCRFLKKLQIYEFWRYGIMAGEKGRRTGQTQ